MSIKEATDGRRAVLEELAHIERDLRDPHALGPNVPDQRMDAAEVTTDSSPDVDPLWGTVIPLLDQVAEQTPFEIAHHLAHCAGGSITMTHPRWWTGHGRHGRLIRFGVDRRGVVSN